jgi:hypothetical protein
LAARRIPRLIKYILAVAVFWTVASVAIVLVELMKS